LGNLSPPTFVTRSLLAHCRASAAYLVAPAIRATGE